MKTNDVPNKVVVQTFLKAIIEIIAQSTSSKYSLLVVNRITDKLSSSFSFSKSIRIQDNTIEIGQNVNSIDKKELKNFFSEIIDMAGADYLKSLLMKRLNEKQINYLRFIGLKLY